MQGDPVIDKLMQPVITALMRHGIKGDAKTDIYNRAYEAIMNSMDVISGELKAANKDAIQLAAQLEREQNPGYSCHELREHYKRVKNSQDEI